MKSITLLIPYQKPKRSMKHPLITKWGKKYTSICTAQGLVTLENFQDA